MADTSSYAARLDIDYPERLDRLTTLLRLIWAIPILIILGLLSNASTTQTIDAAGQVVQTSGGGIAAGLTIATLLMIVFRQKYPRWWFDFALELGRFSARVGAYMLLLTDRYPSTDEAQSVHLDVDYPDAQNGLNRWLPLVKWLLAIPHYIVLIVLFVVMIIVTILAWVIILLTGSYPRALFDFVVGTLRWGTRVWAYAFLLVTDEYPPFSLR
ncbi:MAG: DUF4389 domain-containing protein [Alphaproteobacteria bacterium]|nr:DUF4389 domain-containing protein [Alphaproteobacteria bacterium]